MEFNFEKFEAGPVESHVDNAHVTINRRGTFFLNRRAVDQLGDPESVELFFDRRKSVIGVARAPASSNSAFRLKAKEKKRHGGRILYAANFCRHYSIRTGETLAFTAAEIKDGILILDLNEVRSVRKVS